MTPEKTLNRLRDLQEKYGRLNYGEQLVVDGKPIDVRFPEFLTDGDSIYVFPFGLKCDCETAAFDSKFQAKRNCGR